MAPCPSCGARQQVGERFCGSCGAPAAPTTHLDTPDVLASPSRSLRGRRTVVVGLAAALVAVIGAGAVYASSVLGGGGAQPEDVLPADSVFFAKIDLDPSVGQKLAAYRLAKKFPDSGVTGQDDVQGQLLSRLLDDRDRQEYVRDVEPWLGERAGLAVLPRAPGAGDPQAVAAVQYTDRGEAQRGLTALAAAHPGDGAVHWAFARDEDYVLLSDEQAVVDRVAAAGGSLGGADRYRSAVKALGGDQVAVGFVDVAGVWASLSDDERRSAQSAEPGLDPHGVVVVGAHLESDAVEVTARAVGVTPGGGRRLQDLTTSPLGRAPATGLVGGLPADSTVAGGVTGLGDAATELFDTFRDTFGEQVRALRDQYDVRLPEDLEAVLGDETAVAFGGRGEDDLWLQGRVRTPDAARATKVLGTLTDLATRGDPAAARELSVAPAAGGYTLSYTQHGRGADTLSGSDAFRRAVPDAATSGVTLYADVTRLLALARAGGDDLTDRQRRNLEPLQAFGLTARVDGPGDATVRMRLTVR